MSVEREIRLISSGEGMTYLNGSAWGIRGLICEAGRARDHLVHREDYQKQIFRLERRDKLLPL